MTTANTTEWVDHDPESTYQKEDPDLSKVAHDILIQYSGIPEDKLVSHVREVRERAWKVFQYPCIGKYAFLDFSVSDRESYPQVLERLKGGQTLLDVACCFGQDVRKLVYDGAPITNVFGSELEQRFVDLGFDLFQDRDRLAGQFTAGDLFSDDLGGLAGKQFDMIHAASFFHLFSWKDQVDVMSRTVRLLKPKSGSVIFGRQTAVDEAREQDHPANPRSGKMYRHDDSTFRKLVKEVGEVTKVDLKVEIKRMEVREELMSSDGVHFISFSIIIG
ncbi:methyltransferase domain-containing protein [Zymoseptoria brevis]|uniref:Methyltransferase domain-containing protein n=1 Tax=Zymoseptoria brevis TaxID=1047168 RepID=A0A0F4GQE6_9PEZI|nr:methyltransferase domain-containing protein [Zymoseptoria brevis]